MACTTPMWRAIIAELMRFLTYFSLNRATRLQKIQNNWVSNGQVVVKSPLEQDNIWKSTVQNKPLYKCTEMRRHPNTDVVAQYGSFILCKEVSKSWKIMRGCVFIKRVRRLSYWICLLFSFSFPSWASKRFSSSSHDDFHTCSFIKFHSAPFCTLLVQWFDLRTWGTMW